MHNSSIAHTIPNRSQKDSGRRCLTRKGIRMSCLDGFRYRRTVSVRFPDSAILATSRCPAIGDEYFICPHLLLFNGWLLRTVHVRPVVYISRRWNSMARGNPFLTIPLRLFNVTWGSVHNNRLRCTKKPSQRLELDVEADCNAMNAGNRKKEGRLSLCPIFSDSSVTLILTIH